MEFSFDAVAYRGLLFRVACVPQGFQYLDGI